MNNLDHVKGFYPENYKLDLSETMKAALSKVPNQQIPVAGSTGNSGVSGQNNPTHNELQQGNGGIPGVGYVTEKLYMLLQLYLQNKGWNPSAELLQCFTDLKDNAMLPSAAYLQVLANRLTLDTQGRLILRENGKIVLPFEHFANAVMLKHMSGPHGLHLSVDATVRAVIESYTIGRENFGMEKEFIIEVVQSCPSPACRYYKNHLGMSPLPFMEQQFSGINPSDFLQHLPHLGPPTPHQHSSSGGPAANVNLGNASTSSSSSSINSSSTISTGGEVDLSKTHSQQKLQQLTKQQQTQLSQLSAAAAAAAAHQSQREQAVAVAAAAAAHHQQQLQQQVAQQQAAAAAAAVIAKQQQQQQQAAAAVAAQQQQQLTSVLIQQQNRALAQQSLEKFSNLSTLEKQRILQQLDQKHFDPMSVAAAAANLQIQGLVQSQGVGNSSGSPSSSCTSMSGSGMSIGSATTGANNSINPQLALPSPTAHSSSSSSSHSTEQKSADVLRSSLESLESNKDLLALHNGAWGLPESMRDLMPIGQDNIVRVFAELMRNMARMKSYIRPSMCKPYGKQSESLQKTLLDTIQIVQTLRNCLPAPHIPVTSWKSESEGSSGSNGLVAANLSTVKGSGTGPGNTAVSSDFFNPYPTIVPSQRITSLR